VRLPDHLRPCLLDYLGKRDPTFLRRLLLFPATLLPFLALTRVCSCVNCRMQKAPWAMSAPSRHGPVRSVPPLCAIAQMQPPPGKCCTLSWIRPCEQLAHFLHRVSGNNGSEANISATFKRIVAIPMPMAPLAARSHELTKGLAADFAGHYRKPSPFVLQWLHLESRH